MLKICAIICLFYSRIFAESLIGVASDGPGSVVQVYEINDGAGAKLIGSFPDDLRMSAFQFSIGFVEDTVFAVFAPNSTATYCSFNVKTRATSPPVPLTPPDLAVVSWAAASSSKDVLVSFTDNKFDQGIGVLPQKMSNGSLETWWQWNTTYTDGEASPSGSWVTEDADGYPMVAAVVENWASRSLEGFLFNWSPKGNGLLVKSATQLKMPLDLVSFVTPTLQLAFNQLYGIMRNEKGTTHHLVSIDPAANWTVTAVSPVHPPSSSGLGLDLKFAVSPFNPGLVYVQSRGVLYEWNVSNNKWKALLKSSFIEIGVAKIFN